MPLLAELFPQFASRLIRNGATLGGNLGTASPIGDAPPALLALEAAAGAGLGARGARWCRSRTTSPATGRASAHADELIKEIVIPRPLAAADRLPQDRQAPLRRHLQRGGRVRAGRRATGSSARRRDRARRSRGHADPRPGHGGGTGRPALDRGDRPGAAEVLAAEGTPIDDHRASSGYRVGDARAVAVEAARAEPDPDGRSRGMSHLSQRPESDPATMVVGSAIPHEAAALHVTGQALYTDDLVARTKDCLHAWPVQATVAKARITSLDVAPAYDVPGVVRVLTAADVPGVNDAGVKHDEPLFPDEVRFYGHAVCWVLGETLEAARLGAAAVVLELEPVPALVNVKEAIAAAGVPGRAADGRSVATWPCGIEAADARVQRRARVRRAGALLPRDALRPGAGRRGRPGLRAEQHPAPVGDPGDRGPRAGPAQPRGHGAVPADGRRRSAARRCSRTASPRSPRSAAS